MAGFRIFGRSLMGTSDALGVHVTNLTATNGGLASNDPGSFCTSGFCTAPGNCFVAGTPIATPEGPMAIERVRAGDRVTSIDPDTGEAKVEAVLATYRTPDREVVDVELRDRAALRVTPGHVFFSADRGWIVAGSLREGERLVDASGARVEVARVIARAERETVYNFEVDVTHTYFAGEARVLVHNPSAQPPPSAAAQASGTTVPIGTYQNNGITINVTRTKNADGSFRLSYSSPDNASYHGYADYKVGTITNANGRPVVDTELSTITAQPEGQGLGGFLMNQVAHDGQSMGAVTMTTTATAPTAQPFYQKLGLQPDPTIWAGLAEAEPTMTPEQLKPMVPIWSGPIDDVADNSDKYNSTWAPPPSNGECVVQ
jgi:hypothetical protein